MNSTHDIDRLRAVIAHARAHGLDGTIGTVGVSDGTDTTVFVDERADFIRWARSIDAATVYRSASGYFDAAHGRLAGGVPAVIKVSRPPRVVEEGQTFTLADYETGGGEAR